MTYLSATVVEDHGAQRVAAGVRLVAQLKSAPIAVDGRDAGDLSVGLVGRGRRLT